MSSVKGFREIEWLGDLMITMTSNSLNQTNIKKSENLKESDSYSKDLKLVAILSQIRRHEEKDLEDVQ